MSIFVSLKTGAVSAVRSILFFAAAAVVAACANPLAEEALVIRQEAASPVLSVVDASSTALAANGTLAFPDTSIAGSSELSLTIRNTGKSELDIDLADLSVSLGSGTETGCFAIKTWPSAKVAAGGSTTFALSFSPASLGAKSATVSLPTNDVVAGTFVFALSGKGVSGAKDITAFAIKTPAAAGLITGTDIGVNVSIGTDVTTLIALFTTSGVSVSVGGIVQTNGVTANDFTSPVVFTVKAADGSTKDYTVTVTVDATIPTLTTASASGIKGTSATSGGSISSDGGADVVERGVCWGFSANPTTADNKVVDLGSGIGSYSCTLTGLTPDTYYYARAYATNSAGTAYGAQVSFTTAALPSVSTGAAGGIGTTTASLSGNVDDDGRTEVTSRGICWNTSGSPTIADSKTIDGAGLGSYIGSVSGLAVGTRYYVRAYATNAVGTSYGGEISFITLPVVPSSPTLGAVGYPAGSGKLAVSWTSANGSATVYDVYCSPSSTIPGTASMSDIADLSCALGGLTDFTPYYVWVVAKNTSGSSAPSATLESPVSPGVAVSSISLNKASATFLYGSSETITATCSPENATYPTVSWNSSAPTYASVSSGGVVTGGSAAGTATITATAADGKGATAAFAATTKAYALGSEGLAGGILFYDKGSYSDGWRYMEAAPTAWNASGDIAVPWIIGGATQTTLNGNTSTAIGSGLANSEAIIAQEGHTNSAAAVCRAYAGGGRTDWYLPSKDAIAQMQLIYSNLGMAGVYWSSSEVDASNAWAINISTAFMYSYVRKGAAEGQPEGAPYDYKVRPIRKF